jgi:hypothetical protein
VEQPFLPLQGPLAVIRRAIAWEAVRHSRSFFVESRVERRGTPVVNAAIRDSSVINRGEQSMNSRRRH